MSLRVLLADESASIRKVFQMGLQDFGAEVKSVQNGLDVVEVARNYKPHIVFADILLQKKNGYEVCEEIKQTPELQNLPVILMWSSFMELDQKKYRASGAQGDLEKPFEVESMRRLITNLVEFTRSQKISEFLKFPQSIKDEFVEDEQTNQRPPSETSLPPTPPVLHMPGEMPLPPFDESHENLDVDLKMELEAPDEENHNVQPDFKLDDDFMGRVPMETQAPVAEKHHTQTVATAGPPKFEFASEEEVDSGSLFNTLIEDDEDEHEASEPETIPPPHFQALEESDMNEEPWAVKPLHKNNPLREEVHPQIDDSDEFQSMDLHRDQKKMDLNDFLYKPNSKNEALDPVKPNRETTQDQISKVQISGSTESSYNTISPEETEAIIRSETRQLLKEMISKELSGVLERVVREELNNILKQEMELQSKQQHTVHE